LAASTAGKERIDLIIVLRSNATDEDLRHLAEVLKDRGYGVHISKGVEKTIVGAIGAPDSDKELIAQQIETYHFVEKVIPILKPYKIVNIDFRPEGSVIKVKEGVEIGGKQIHVMAGPCCIENDQMLMDIAWGVKKAGATILRGGAFKPSTSPYSFQGLGYEGLQMLAHAGKETGLAVITEAMAVNHVEAVAAYADIIQIGTRNMQNYPLLKEVGQADKPVMLKRGMWATIEEWMQAAEYIASNGNLKIILCERGIRTFETYTRNTFDINAIPAAKELSHLPVIGDSAHGTGKWTLVRPVARAAIAAGADGVMVEVHPHPSHAFKDGFQSLTFEHFEQLMAELAPVAEAVGRFLAGPAKE
jgi:3-deoxy-7-phosphoheptulonate synthase